MLKENLSLLDLYKERFKTSLVGKWVTAEGTFAMHNDLFEFFENGKGYWLSSDLRNSVRCNFEWRKKALFVIDLKDTESDDWVSINYNFKPIKNDFGDQIILCQNNTDTFYLATTKIGYSKELKLEKIIK